MAISKSNETQGRRSDALDWLKDFRMGFVARYADIVPHTEGAYVPEALFTVPGLGDGHWAVAQFCGAPVIFNTVSGDCIGDDLGFREPDGAFVEDGFNAYQKEHRVDAATEDELLDELRFGTLSVEAGKSMTEALDALVSRSAAQLEKSTGHDMPNIVAYNCFKDFILDDGTMTPDTVASLVRLAGEDKVGVIREELRSRLENVSSRAYEQGVLTPSESSAFKEAAGEYVDTTFSKDNLLSGELSRRVGNVFAFHGNADETEVGRQAAKAANTPEFGDFSVRNIEKWIKGTCKEYGLDFDKAKAEYKKFDKQLSGVLKMALVAVAKSKVSSSLKLK